MHRAPVPRKWFNIDEAAYYSGFSSRHIRNLINDGEVKGSTPTRGDRRKGRLLVEIASLDAWIEKGEGKRSPKVRRANNEDKAA